VLTCRGQGDTSKIREKTVSAQPIAVVDSSKQLDLADEIYKLLGKSQSLKNTARPKKINISIVPSLGYTLSSGFTLDLTGNAAFYTSKAHTENLSAIINDLSYDSKSQKIFISRSEIWAPENRYKFVSDIRVEEFPMTTYGLGTTTTDAQANHLFYDYVKVYSTMYKKIIPNFYAGVGYNLDYHFNIAEQGDQDGQESDFKKYGEPQHSSSSGLNADLLFDSRRNPINPLGGTYASLVFRQNFTFIGSDAYWRSVMLDVRRYIKLSPHSNNILAVWGIAWFASSGTPYLDLPATAGDMYGNSGRGYAAGRFIGKNMLYIESEYRFGITSNGLFGGVIFANGESFSGLNSNAFERIAPAAGAGIRIKANKHSNTNICIDYGVGTKGSHCFFVNLGEVF